MPALKWIERPSFMRYWIVGVIGLLLGSVCSVTLAEEVVGLIPGPVRLVLPQVIPAVVGRECNLYFDNIVLVPDPGDYIFDVTCLRGNQYSECWRWTPPEADVGDIRWKLDVRDGNNRVIASGESIVRVSAANRRDGESISMLCVGDSLTHASVYTQQLLDRSAQPGNPKISLIGTHYLGEPGPNRHEGYGGWTARRFVTHYTDTARMGEYSKRGSPFLYRDAAGQLSLDFSRYCQDVNEGRTPDLVTIFLGPNDLYPYTDDVIEAQIDDVFANLNQLISMVQQANSKTRVAVMLPVPPCSSQDAFGENYGSNQTRWQYKRNIHRMVERLQDEFTARDGVSLVPTNIALDCVHNYPTHAVRANAANEAQLVRQNNSVHPSHPGYIQIGDALFDWIKGQ